MRLRRWWAESAPPGWNRVKVSENLGATAVAPVAPVDTSLNPISTEKSRLCPPHYYWHRRIFRPSYGPDLVFGLVCGRLGRSRVHEFLVPARIHVQDLYKLTLVEIYE